MADDADTHEKDVEEIDERMQKLTHREFHARPSASVDQRDDGVHRPGAGTTRSWSSTWRRSRARRPRTRSERPVAAAVLTPTQLDAHPSLGS